MARTTAGRRRNAESGSTTPLNMTAAARPLSGSAHANDEPTLPLCPNDLERAVSTEGVLGQRRHEAEPVLAHPVEHPVVGRRDRST